MKPPSKNKRTSNSKDTLLSVKKTPLKRTRKLSSIGVGSASVESSSSAITRAQRKAAASHEAQLPSTSKPAARKLLEDAEISSKNSAKHSSSSTASHAKSVLQDNVAMETDDAVTWITISNVHTAVAYEDIIQVLFGHIGTLKGLILHRDKDGHFRGSIDVAFKKREDAEDAVDTYEDNIALFGMPWKIQRFGKRRCTRLYHSASSSSTSLHTHGLRSKKLAFLTAESSSSIRPVVERAQRLQVGTVEIGVSARVLISNIDPRVPTDIIEVLFQKAGKLTSHHAQVDAKSNVTGSAVLKYERSEDAVAAVKHFKDNIIFFKNVWKVELDHVPPATAKRGHKGHSRLSMRATPA